MDKPEMISVISLLFLAVYTDLLLKASIKTHAPKRQFLNIAGPLPKEPNGVIPFNLSPPLTISISEI